MSPARPDSNGDKVPLSQKQLQAKEDSLSKRQETAAGCCCDCCRTVGSFGGQTDGSVFGCNAWQRRRSHGATRAPGAWLSNFSWNNSCASTRRPGRSLACSCQFQKSQAKFHLISRDVWRCFPSLKLRGRFSFLRCFKGFRLSVLLEGPGCSCTAEVERVLPEEQAPSPALFQPLHGRVQGEAWRVSSCFFRCVPAFPRRCHASLPSPPPPSLLQQHQQQLGSAQINSTWDKNATCSTQLSSTWLNSIQLVSR